MWRDINWGAMKKYNFLEYVNDACKIATTCFIAIYTCAMTTQQDVKGGCKNDGLGGADCFVSMGMGTKYFNLNPSLLLSIIIDHSLTLSIVFDIFMYCSM